ncbi:MAG: T9SS type A sorting domain-containing protein [Bacteroidetes bacterium]|nr:T9SS type A sorting domain-containing protein [Bacteroidota bacterium]
MAIVGPNDGLVQAMGVNKCGIGSSKSLSVTIGAPGGDPPGGGGIPFMLGGESNRAIEVYPNPVKDEFVVSLASNSKSNIKLFDINGKLVYAKNTSQHKEIIKTIGLSNGIYFLQIQGETNAIKKIIVKH